jgi:Kae1-associated kinase Bud32
MLEKLGTLVAHLHDSDIVHEDLTTSNIMIRSPTILKDELQQSNSFNNGEEIVLIDFGLSHVSYSLEDKAVDLYLLERNFTSTHPLIDTEFKHVLNGYMTASSKAPLISKKLADG